MQTYNFGAGPGQLPVEILEQIKADIPAWRDGMSVMEISHRSKHFQALTQSAEETLRSLLNIPDNYHVLFLQGGARAQFSMVPMNLLQEGDRASYAITGIWSKLAYEDACQFGDIDIAVNTELSNYTALPTQSQWELNPKSAYLHVTDNETINGVEFNWLPEFEGCIVSDMTSNFLSRSIDVAKYGLIYASAQKNIGIAGLTVVIVDEACLKATLPRTPLLYDYRVAIMSHSVLNTPPTFAWYVADLMFKWLQQKGGVEAMHTLSQSKSNLLYDFIDGSEFYQNNVLPSCRSRMNIPFTLADENLEISFLSEAAECGLQQLQGHRSVGGCRASLYNAMPMEGVQALIDFMQAFEKKHG